MHQIISAPKNRSCSHPFCNKSFAAYGWTSASFSLILLHYVSHYVYQPTTWGWSRNRQSVTLGLYHVCALVSRYIIRLSILVRLVQELPLLFGKLVDLPNVKSSINPAFLLIIPSLNIHSILSFSHVRLTSTRCSKPHELKTKTRIMENGYHYNLFLSYRFAIFMTSTITATSL